MPDISAVYTTLDATPAAKIITAIFTADEAMDAARFTEVLTEGVTFRMGSGDTLIGREAVRQAVEQFFHTITGLRHRLLAVWEREEELVYRAEVTYTLPDNRSVTLPYMNYLVKRDEFIQDYNIYIDLSPLQSLPSR